MNRETAWTCSIQTSVDGEHGRNGDLGGASAGEGYEHAVQHPLYGTHESDEEDTEIELGCAPLTCKIGHCYMLYHRHRILLA